MLPTNIVRGTVQGLVGLRPVEELQLDPSFNAKIDDDVGVAEGNDVALSERKWRFNFHERSRPLAQVLYVVGFRLDRVLDHEMSVAHALLLRRDHNVIRDIPANVDAAVGRGPAGAHHTAGVYVEGGSARNDGAVLHHEEQQRSLSDLLDRDLLDFCR